jgi:hypothetical protein
LNVPYSAGAVHTAQRVWHVLVQTRGVTVTAVVGTVLDAAPELSFVKFVAWIAELQFSSF